MDGSGSTRLQAWHGSTLPRYFKGRQMPVSQRLVQMRWRHPGCPSAPLGPGWRWLRVRCLAVVLQEGHMSCVSGFTSALCDPQRSGATGCRSHVMPGATQLSNAKGLYTWTQTQDELVFILLLMILKVIFSPDERSMKGVRLALPGLASACCDHAGCSSVIRCLLHYFGFCCWCWPGHTKVLMFKPRRSPRLLSRAHQGHSSNCLATCLGPEVGHEHSLWMVLNQHLHTSYPAVKSLKAGDIWNKRFLLAPAFRVLVH